MSTIRAVSAHGTVTYVRLQSRRDMLITPTIYAIIACRYNLLLGSTDSRYPLLPAPDNLISRWSIGLGKLGIVLSLAS